MKKIIIVLIVFILSGCSYISITEKYLPLHELYKDYFDIGVAVMSSNISQIQDEYSTITAEYEMKWDQIEINKDEFEFSNMDVIANYARDNDIKLRGHTIVWYQTTPYFIKDIEYLNISTEEKMDLCLEYIKDFYSTVYSRYSDILICYDVINEVISDSNNPNELYRLDDPYYKMFEYNDELFEKFIKEVLLIVKDVSPNIIRYYNDYFVLTNYIKRTKVIEFINKINSDEILIQGIGAQSHISTSITYDDVIETLNSFKKLDIEFSFTELDISVYISNEEEVNYEDVEVSLAKAYNTVFSVAREYSDFISNITFWGINDSSTWLDTDNRKDYPLLFDVDGNKKYAYYVISNFQRGEE